MASTIVLTPSTDKTGATDTAAINTALGNVGSGGSVLLGPGDWYTDAPLDIPDGTELAGIKGGSTGRPRPPRPVRSSTRSRISAGKASSACRPFPGCG